jgi:hypothetical protein
MQTSYCNKETIVGILLGEIIPDKAAALCEIAIKCPYCSSLSQSAGTILGLYVIPKENRWWLEWVKQEPTDTLGLLKAEVYFTQRILASSPWSRGEIQSILEKAPCEANCLECIMYLKKCPGCPATQHFRGR